MCFQYWGKMNCHWILFMFLGHPEVLTDFHIALIFLKSWLVCIRLTSIAGDNSRRTFSSSHKSIHRDSLTLAQYPAFHIYMKLFGILSFLFFLNKCGHKKKYVLHSSFCSCKECSTGQSLLTLKIVYSGDKFHLEDNW